MNDNSNKLLFLSIATLVVFVVAFIISAKPNDEQINSMYESCYKECEKGAERIGVDLANQLICDCREENEIGK